MKQEPDQSETTIRPMRDAPRQDEQHILIATSDGWKIGWWTNWNACWTDGTTDRMHDYVPVSDPLGWADLPPLPKERVE